MPDFIKCDTCPRCYDRYPGKLDLDGYHFYICGNGGNMVYKEPRKVKRVRGSGYIHYPASGCGLYESAEEALSKMTVPEISRYKAAPEGGTGQQT